MFDDTILLTFDYFMFYLILLLLIIRIQYLTKTDRPDGGRKDESIFLLYKQASETTTLHFLHTTSLSCFEMPSNRTTTSGQGNKKDSLQESNIQGAYLPFYFCTSFSSIKITSTKLLHVSHRVKMISGVK